MENPVYCEKCGKCMTKETGESVIGISLTFDQSETTGEFVQQQLGKYVIGKTYNFCWECWLDSLMGK